VSVDLFVGRLSSRARSIIEAVGATLGCGVFATFSWKLSTEACQSYKVGEFWGGLIDYPIWPLRWVVFLGAALYTLQLVNTAVDGFRNAMRKGKC